MLPGNELLQAEDRTRSRILDAALAQFERYGLRRTTVEDVARRAGLSRVTIHRHFGTKEALVQEVVLREGRRFFDALEAAISAHEGAVERIADGFAFALEYLKNHELFNQLLESEPDALLPYLTREAGSLLVLARTWVADKLGQRVREGSLPLIDVEAVGEVLARLALSFLLTPETTLAIGGREQTREWARSTLVPALLAGARTSGSA